MINKDSDQTDPYIGLEGDSGGVEEEKWTTKELKSVLMCNAVFFNLCRKFLLGMS